MEETMKNQIRKQLASWIRVGLAVGLVALITLGITRVAVATFSQGAQAQPNTIGSLSGIVLAEDTEEPISAVSVSLFDVVNVAPYPVYFGFTDADGLFDIEGIEAGEYLIRFRPSADSIYQTVFYENNTTVEIVAGQKTSIEAALPRSGLISGRVLDRIMGEPVSNVTVSAYTYGQFVPVSQTTSNDDGTYTLSNIDGETLWLRFEANDLSTSTPYLPYNHLSKFTINAPDHETDINAQLQQGAQISGLVSDAATSSPIDRVTVMVYNENNRLIHETKTDVDGSYRTGGLYPGSYKLCFSKRSGSNQYFDRCYPSAESVADATTLSLAAAERKTGVNTFLSLSATAGNATLAGRVTDATTGAPLSDIRVTVYDPQGAIQNSAQTLETGYYTFTNLIEGEYKLYFSAESGFDSVNYVAQYYNNVPTLSETESISIGDEDSRTDLDVAMQQGGGISGTVESAATGRSLSSILVKLYDESGKTLATTATDIDGLFSFNRLATGNYILEFNPSAENATYLGEFYGDANSQQDATFVSVTAPNVTDALTISLQKGSLIAGMVTGVDSSLPLADVDISVYAQNGCTPIATGVTNAVGAYTTSPALKAGSYRVEFKPSKMGSSSQYLPDAEASIVQITQPNYFGNIDTTLALGAVLYGRIVAADSGLPLDQVTIQPIQPVQANGSRIYGSFLTNAAGLYASYGLPAGSYALELNSFPISKLASSMYAAKNNIELILPAAQAVEHNDLLARGGQISGRIVSAETDIAIESVNVALYSVEADSFVSFAFSREDGTYRFGGLADGVYKVQFQPKNDSVSSAQPTDYRWETYGGNASVESGTEVIIQAANSVAGIDAALEAGGQISGTVFDANNKPLPSSAVLVTDQAGNPIGQSSSDQNGHYITNGLPAGEAIVSFYQTITDDQCQSEVISIYYNNRPDSNSANSVTVANGAITDRIDIVMDPDAVPDVTPTPEATDTPVPSATPQPIETTVGNNPNATVTPIPSTGNTYLPLVNQ